MGAILPVIGTWLLTKGLKLTLAIGFLITSLFVLKAGVLSTISGFIMPDLIIPIWNFFDFGGCFDILLSAYITVWLFSFRMILLKIFSE